MRKPFTLLLFLTITTSLFGQKQEEKRTILNKTPEGKIIREQIKFIGSDTLLHIVYDYDGPIQSEYQVLNDSRNGLSKTYDYNGNLRIQETFKNNQREGKTIRYHENGHIGALEFWKSNAEVDSTLHFDSIGNLKTITKFRAPCSYGSNECDTYVTHFLNGKRVYSYEVKQGIKSEDLIIHDKKAYELIEKSKSEKSLVDLGKPIFSRNCSMCHRKDQAIIGPAIGCISKRKNEKEFRTIISGENGHNEFPLTDSEIQALLEFLNNNCP